MSRSVLRGPRQICRGVAYFTPLLIFPGRILPGAFFRGRSRQIRFSGRRYFCFFKFFPGAGKLPCSIFRNLTLFSRFLLKNCENDKNNIECCNKLDINLQLSCNRLAINLQPPHAARATRTGQIERMGWAVNCHASSRNSLRRRPRKRKNRENGTGRTTEPEKEAEAEME